ncbi:MAG: hypothetical protein M5U34_25370 [Chloroflexi bacterium]|nr:hypothetical protein [Chloroflexota bacterium]
MYEIFNDVCDERRHFADGCLLPGGGELTPVPEPIETKPALETAVPLSTSQPTTAAYPDAGYPAAASILKQLTLTLGRMMASP